MDQIDIRQVAVIPPALDEMQVRPERVAVAFPGKIALVDPVVPERVKIGIQRRKRLADEPGGVVERIDERLGVVRGVIPQRHENVADVAADHDVLHLRMIGQSIEGSVGFHEAPVRLRLQIGDHFFQRHDAHVDPGGNVVEGLRGRLILKDQQGDDALHPGGAALHRGTDEDVVVANPDAVPAGTVEVMKLIGVRALGQCCGHGLPPVADGCYRPGLPGQAIDGIRSALPAADKWPPHARTDPCRNN